MVLSKSGTGMILVYADEIDTSHDNSITQIKEMFIKIEKETKKVGLNISQEKTKFMYVNRKGSRDRMGQNITRNICNFECEKNSSIWRPTKHTKLGAVKYTHESKKVIIALCIAGARKITTALWISENPHIENIN